MSAAFFSPNSHAFPAECGIACSEANPFDFAAGLEAHARMPAGRVFDKLNARAEDAVLIAEAEAARKAHVAEVNRRYKALMKERRREFARQYEAARRARKKAEIEAGIVVPPTLTADELAAKREQYRRFDEQRRARIKAATERHRLSTVGAMNSAGK